MDYIKINFCIAKNEIERFGVLKPTRDIFYKFINQDILEYDSSQIGNVLVEGGGNLHTIEQLYLDKYIVFNNGIIVRPRYYSSDIINRYFQYRLFRFKCLDHGIIGADKLMGGLIKIIVASLNNVLCKPILIILCM